MGNSCCAGEEKSAGEEISAFQKNAVNLADQLGASDKTKETVGKGAKSMVDGVNTGVAAGKDGMNQLKNMWGKK